MMDRPVSRVDSTQQSTLKPGSTQSDAHSAVFLGENKRNTQTSSPVKQDQRQTNSTVRLPSPVVVSKKSEFAPPLSKPIRIPFIPKSRASSRRVKYVRRCLSPVEDTPVDKTLKGETKFLKNLEEHRGKRLLRTCYCPLSCWLRFKEITEVLLDNMLKYLRVSRIICCPPCCNIPKRIAFWPPPRAYFFFRSEANSVERKSTENDEEWLAELSQRKKRYTKLRKGNSESTEGTWRIGIEHRCVDDVEGVDGFILETETGNFIACVKAPCLKINPRYSIIYSHPSGSDLSDHLLGMPSLKDMARFYRSDIYSYDYSGYGVSSGTATEENQNADIRAIYKHLTETLHIPPTKIILIGYSIGTAASVDLVRSLEIPVAGLVLEAPPTSIMRVMFWNRGCFKQPWKEDKCCADRFCTFEKIGDITVPILIIHGMHDTMVPVQHGQEVFERTKKKVPPLWVDAEHDDLENYREVWTRIRKFLREEVKEGVSIEERENLEKR